jgi:8-oxo-dGTP pyrophosphatase MutT (NUDIX family)
MGESKVLLDTAGIAIVYDGKILLVHPANGSWVKPLMGIPKGKIEPGEEPMDAAIRETFEETGILIRPDKLSPAVQSVEIWKGDKYRNSLHYLECKINDLSEIGLDSLKVPKSQLQSAEIDWAGFIKISEAYSKVINTQLLILDRLS